MGYADIGDNELIYLIRSNNMQAKDYLIARYKKRIYGMINSFKKQVYIKELDYEDYYHSCFVVFLKCLELFDDNYNFYSYVSNAIMKELQRLINKEKEDKEIIPINYDIESYQSIDYVSDGGILYKEKELKDYIKNNFQLLDRKIIDYKLNGYNCLEIASLLGIDKKKVYKRMACIREKLLTRK